MTDIAGLQLKLDAYKSLRDMRLEEQRKVDHMKEGETKIQNELAAYLTDNPDLNGIIGTTHKAILKHSTIPIITNLSVLKQYIMDNDAWDLISMKISPPAVRERWEDMEQIPGVESMPQVKLSVTKI